MNITRSIYSKSPCIKESTNLSKENINNNSTALKTQNQYPKTDIRTTKKQRPISDQSRNNADSAEKHAWISSIREILKSEPVRIASIQTTDQIKKISQTPKITLKPQQANIKPIMKSPRFPTTPMAGHQLVLDNDASFHNEMPNPPKLGSKTCSTLTSPIQLPKNMSLSNHTVVCKVSPKCIASRSSTPVRYNSSWHCKYYNLRFSIFVFISFVILLLLMQLIG